jgi:hypothetical protein
LTARAIEIRYSPAPLATDRARIVPADAESSATTTTPAMGAPVSLSRIVPRAVCALDRDAAKLHPAMTIVVTPARDASRDPVTERGTLPAISLPIALLEDFMSKLLRGLAAGYGAKKLGGGCFSTILIFLILWYILGHFRIFQ